MLAPCDLFRKGRVGPRSEQPACGLRKAPRVTIALDERSDAADQHRRDDESRPEADNPADLKPEEETRMGEIEHAHHAEDGGSDGYD